MTPPTSDALIRRLSSSGSDGPSKPTVNSWPTERFKRSVAPLVGARCNGNDDDDGSGDLSDGGITGACRRATRGGHRRSKTCSPSFGRKYPHRPVDHG
jgi:hypothetical protein